MFWYFLNSFFPHFILICVSIWTVFVYFDKFCWRLFEIDPNFLKTSRKLMQMKRPDFNHYQTHMRLHSCFFPISGWFENVIPFDWDEAKRMWRESFKWNWIANALKWFRFSFHKKKGRKRAKDSNIPMVNQDQSRTRSIDRSCVSIGFISSRA